MDAGSKNVSNCALQIALQTMKDRCQQLQLRLSNLEDENLKLRIDKRKSETITHDKESEDNAIRKLNEEVEMLSQQKSQLTHHIFMVATENKQLWTNLSMLTEEKNMPEQSLNLVKDNSKSDLLKEVDTNIAKNLERLDLSKCDAKESPSMKDFEFNLSSMMSTNGEDSNNFEIMELGEELNQTKTQMKSILSQLKNQQILMRATMKSLIQAKKEKENKPPPLCSNCNLSRKQLRDKTYKVSKPPALTNGNENASIGGYNYSAPAENDDFEESLMVSAQVCPLCQHIESEESEFLQHVYSHFGESNEEDESPPLHTGSNTLEHGSVFPQFNI